jgi:hypothetical protein
MGMIQIGQLLKKGKMYFMAEAEDGFQIVKRHNTKNWNQIKKGLN